GRVRVGAGRGPGKHFGIDAPGAPYGDGSRGSTASQRASTRTTCSPTSRRVLARTCRTPPARRSGGVGDVGVRSRERHALVPVVPTDDGGWRTVVAADLEDLALAPGRTHLVALDHEVVADLGLHRRHLPPYRLHLIIAHSSR